MDVVDNLDTLVSHNDIITTITFIASLHTLTDQILRLQLAPQQKRTYNTVSTTATLLRRASQLSNNAERRIAQVKHLPDALKSSERASKFIFEHSDMFVKESSRSSLT